MEPLNISRPVALAWCAWYVLAVCIALPALCVWVLV